MLPRLLDELVWPNNWRDARRLSDDMTVRPSGDIDRRRRAVAELCGDGLNIAYCSVSDEPRRFHSIGDSVWLLPRPSVCDLGVVGDSVATGSSSSSIVSAISFSEAIEPGIEADRNRPGDTSSGVPKASGATAGLTSDVGSACSNKGIPADSGEAKSPWDQLLRRDVPVPGDCELKPARGNVAIARKLVLRRRPRGEPGLGLHDAMASVSSELEGLGLSTDDRDGRPVWMGGEIGEGGLTHPCDAGGDVGGGASGESLRCRLPRVAVPTPGGGGRVRLTCASLLSSSTAEQAGPPAAGSTGLTSPQV